ncbi:MAG: ATP synthase F1 subunit gamma [Candidatus Kaiserbacteria bacterium]|nr:ATP synthase F1 subunit gamma [Candidatus Kaiserbacteria bacterium]
MANLKDIKLKILSYKKTGTVTHAMEAVSAVKMRKAQERALGGRAYAAASLSVLERLAGTADASKHSLMREGSGKTCFIVVVSDKGLAGSLNSGVIRKVEDEIRSRNLNKSDVVMIAIGRRGAEYFASRGYEVRLRRDNLADGVSEHDIRAVTDAVLAGHATGEIGAVVVGYQNFLSTFEQQPTTRQIVPITRSLMQEMIKGIRPAKGKYAPQNPEKDVAPAAYTIEPDADTVLSTLLPRLLNIAIFYSVLEGKASEHSARMVAMKSATDKAKEMAHNLTRTFNKVRQAAITREVSEITSGIEAMK